MKTGPKQGLKPTQKNLQEKKQVKTAQSLFNPIPQGEEGQPLLGADTFTPPMITKRVSADLVMRNLGHSQQEGVCL